MNKYRVESTRLLKYDYSRYGAYYVTIRTKNHKFIFGHFSIGNSNSIDVETGLRPVSIQTEFVISPEGKIVHECWYDLPKHYKNLSLDEFIIMPDHLHGIICINNTDIQCRHGLPEFIRAFKSFASRRINELKGNDESFWQRGYYDHVIKSDNELDRIRKYIRDNPAEWLKTHNVEWPK